MKRIILILATMLVLVAMLVPICVSAEEIDGEVPEEPTTEVVEEPTEIAEGDIDYDKIASDIADKVKGELPDELVKSITDVVEAWKETDSEDATFESRIKEFFAPDNLVGTVSMLFMLVVGIAIFVMRKNQGASIASTNRDLIKLREKIESSGADTRLIADSVHNIIGDVAKLGEAVNELSAKLDDKNTTADEAKKAAVGVATMLRDIFNNSKTIDEAGKKIMNIDYLNAIGEPIERTEPFVDKKVEDVKAEV